MSLLTHQVGCFDIFTNDYQNFSHSNDCQDVVGSSSFPFFFYYFFLTKHFWMISYAIF